MILFYTTNIKGKIATLEGDEAMHCMKTLRKKVGDRVSIMDGKGSWYDGTLVSTSKKSCDIAIENQRFEESRASFKLHIAIAPTKNINRLEWFLEKATEIGIDEITPILCQRSERKTVRLDRLEKIILAATKQSLKSYVPQLNPLTKLEDFIKKEATEHTQKMIAHCNDGEKVALKNAYESPQNALILIGPEGDFSMEEVELAVENGFNTIGLGKERLRTETAGIVACHTVNLLDFSD